MLAVKNGAGRQIVRHKRLLAHLLIICLLIGATPIVLNISSYNVVAVGNTYVFYGNSSALASVASNWAPATGPPGAGDNIIFDTRSGAKPCTLDSAVTYGTFSMNSGYTGVVTVGADFGCTGFSGGGGTLTGSISYTMNDSGDWAIWPTVLTPSVLKLTMSGTGVILDSSTDTIDTLTISGSVSMAGPVAAKNIAVSGMLSITSGGALTYRTSGTYSNIGMITGTGNLVFILADSNQAFALGTITTSGTLEFLQADWDATGRTFTLVEGLSTNANILVDSGHSTATCTLDVSASNYALSATDITIGTRGILIGRDSAITSSGNVDFVNGTFYQNSSSFLMNAGGYAKLASSQQFHNLIVNGTGSRLFVATGDLMKVAENLTVNSGCSASLQNNSYVMQSLVNNGAITQNSKRLNITGSSSTPLTGYGTFDGDLYLNGSTASSYEVQTGLPMGNLYFDRDTKVNVDATRYLQVVPASTEFVDVSIQSIGTEQGYAARWTGTSTGPVTYTVSANANELYDIWVDGTTRIGVVQTSSDGLVQFTYDGPFSSHEFIISKSGGPSVKVEASFSYSITGNQVSFTDKSYGGVAVWVWDFGDGTGSTSQNPVHKYMKSGEYTISLSVYDSKGHSSTAKTTITLELGPDFPIERAPGGWNVWVGDEMTVSIPALGLVVVGAILFLSALYLPSIPFVTPKARKLIGLVLLIVGIGYFVFIDNKWLGG
jgi:PKD repeat protein